MQRALKPSAAMATTEQVCSVDYLLPTHHSRCKGPAARFSGPTHASGAPAPPAADRTMPPKGSGAADGAGRRSAPSASTAAGGPSTSAAAQQQQPAPQPDSFAIEKLQRALAVPPDQRQHSMQAFIDSCECTAEATELLGAAPLAQLSGPTKLRSLLLLLKAHWTFGGESPAVPGISLLPAAMGPGTEMARSNMVALLCQVGGVCQTLIAKLSAAWNACTAPQPLPR